MFLFSKKIAITIFLSSTILNLFFDRNNLPKSSEMLSFEARHVPLSEAIASNVSGHEEAVFFVSNGDSETLVQDMLRGMEAISESAYEILKKKFSYVYDALKDHPNSRSEKLLKQLDQHNKELIILGFNSGRYDLNLIKLLIAIQLHNKIDFVIKKANTYLCLKTEKLRFLDIKNYLAPGYAYKKFLSAFGCKAWYGLEDDFSIFHSGNFLPFHFHSIPKIFHSIFHSILKFFSIFHSILPHQTNFRLETMQRTYILLLFTFTML